MSCCYYRWTSPAWSWEMRCPPPWSPSKPQHHPSSCTPPWSISARQLPAYLQSYRNYCHRPCLTLQTSPRVYCPKKVTISHSGVLNPHWGGGFPAIKGCRLWHFCPGSNPHARWWPLCIYNYPCIACFLCTQNNIGGKCKSHLPAQNPSPAWASWVVRGVAPTTGEAKSGPWAPPHHEGCHQSPLMGYWTYRWNSQGAWMMPNSMRLWERLWPATQPQLQLLRKSTRAMLWY